MIHEASHVCFQPRNNLWNLAKPLIYFFGTRYRYQVSIPQVSSSSTLKTCAKGNLFPTLATCIKVTTLLYTFSNPGNLHKGYIQKSTWSISSSASPPCPQKGQIASHTRIEKRFSPITHIALGVFKPDNGIDLFFSSDRHNMQRIVPRSKYNHTDQTVPSNDDLPSMLVQRHRLLHAHEQCHVFQTLWIGTVGTTTSHGIVAARTERELDVFGGGAGLQIFENGQTFDKIRMPVEYYNSGQQVVGLSSFVVEHGWENLVFRRKGSGGGQTTQWENGAAEWIPGIHCIQQSSMIYNNCHFSSISGNSTLVLNRWEGMNVPSL